jgi:hypothetical protein
MFVTHFLLLALLVSVMPAPAAAAAAPASTPASAPRRTPFTHFGAPPALELREGADAATIVFGVRADELVTHAVFRIRYAYSRALAPAQSHVLLTLNDQVVGRLPVVAEGAGGAVEHAIEVDPRLFVGSNRLVLTLVAQRAGGAEDPERPGLWAEVSGESALEAGIRPLAVADDLALLPEPFFDRRDQRRLTLPFAFGAQPSLPTLRAAAVVASWFGQLAAWRGARFPARLDAAPEGHSIVFATNAERPAFLGSLAPSTGPELRVMTNPADGRSKLLLVLGRDGSDLTAAANALVLRQAGLSGAAARVKDERAPAPRPAYDAPAWVRVDRAMTLGELIDWPQQLHATGRAPRPDPIRVDVRIPPDLVAWRGPGVPLALRFHYTPPACAAESQLDVSINDEPLQTVVLRGAPREGEAAPPASASSGAIAGTADILIPAFRLRSRSQLQFAFRFDRRGDGGCRDAKDGAVVAVVDADSAIDFSGFPHYAEMPNLSHFATVGFPFTRQADLSQTVAVLPELASPLDIEALLALMGRMGESTGAPATGVRVAGANGGAQLADADLLVIGVPAQQALLRQWSESLPVAIAGPSRRAGKPILPVAAVADWLGMGGAREASAPVQVNLEGGDPLAALLGFESPLSPGRSVVALTASSPDQFARVLDAMEDREMRRAMLGSAVFVHPGKVESLRAGRSYSVGFLPPWAGLWHWLSGYPWLLAALGVVALSLLAYAAWRVKQAVLDWRSRARPCAAA